MLSVSSTAQPPAFLLSLRFSIFHIPSPSSPIVLLRLPPLRWSSQRPLHSILSSRVTRPQVEQVIQLN